MGYTSETACYKLEMKLDLRRKQYHLLVTCIVCLQKLLIEDDNS